MPTGDELGRDARHHVAGWRRVGREMRTQDEEVHGSGIAAARLYAFTSCSADDAQSNTLTRARPTAASVDRRSSSPATSNMAAAHPATSSGSRSTPASPTTSGSAVALEA